MSAAATPPPGPGVDARGVPVVDPTENVKELVNASILRLDDLRGQSEAYILAMVKMQADHARELRILEAERINAIRAVDVAASQQQQKDQEIRATALAKQVADTAEQQRSQVAAAAAAAATSLGAALVPIQERLAELTRLQYEQQGQKAQVIESRASDADFAPVLDVLKRLESAQSQQQGRREGVGSSANVLYAILVLAVALVTAAILYSGSHHATPASTITTETVTTPTVTVP